MLAHGAGAPQQHPFMVSFARALSERGLDVMTFNFLYAEQRRKVPDRMPQLVACYRAAIGAARARVDSAQERLFIGGKSMGGRAATHVAADDATLDLAGIVLLGYPLHPPGRPDKTRDAHLPDVRRPMLFVQGSRDTFGTPSELKPVLASLSPLPTLHHVEAGDHSFKIAGRDAKARQAAVYAEIQDTIVDWIHHTG
jgi:predicted alpha/beta-hydrolase family hydrolase